MTPPPLTAQEQLAALLRRLSDAEADLRAFLGDGRDRVSDPTTGMPILLRPAQQALLLSEAYHRRLAALLENVHDSVVSTDLDGRVTYWNSGATAIFGYAAAEMIGQSLAVLYPDPALLASHVGHLRAAREDRLEWQARRKDGTLIWVDTALTPMRNEQGALSGALAVTKDISDRKRAEAALRLSEERYRVISEMTSDFTYSVRITAEGEAIPEWITEAFSRVTGYTLDEVGLLGGLPSIVHPEDAQSYRERFARMLAGEADVRESRVITKSGEIRWLRDYGRPEFDAAAGRVVRIYGAAQDITAQKAAQAAVDERERHFRALIERSADGITLIDSEGQVVYASPATTSIIGGAPEEWLYGYFYTRLHPEEEADLRARFDAMVRQPGSTQTAEIRFRRKDDSWCWLELTGTNLLTEPAVRAIVINFRDISARRAAEDALQREHDLTAGIMATSPVGIVLLDHAGQIVFANPNAERVLGLSHAELLARTYNSPEWHITDFDGQPMADAELPFARVMATGQAVTNVPQAIIWPNGRRTLLTVNAAPVFDAAGQVNGMVAALQDVTDLHQTEQALQHSERRFRALIEHSSDGITLFNRQYQVIYRSPVAERVTGYSNVERLGGRVIDLVHPEDLPAVQAAIDAVAAAGGNSAPIQYRNRHADGSWHWLEAVFSNLLDEPAVQALLANYRDISERVRSDELRAQLAAIVESSDDAIIGHTLTGTIISWNAGAERLFGYPAAEILNRPLAVLVPPDRPDELSILFDRLGRGEHFQQGDTVRMRRDGSRVAVSMSSAPIRDDSGQVISASAIARDITERKLREREQNAVVRMSAALRVADTLAEMFPILLEQVEGLLDASGTALVLLDPETGAAEVTLAKGEWQAGTGRRLPPEGLSLTVIETQQPFYTDTLQTEGRFFARDLLVTIRSAVCVPLRAQQTVIGALWAGRVDPLSPNEVALTLAVADIAAIAIQRATLHEQTQRQLAHVTALHEIDTVIASSLDARLTLGVLLGQALSTLKVDGGAVLLTNPRLNTLEFVIGRGLAAHSVLHQAVPVGQGHAGRAALERRTISLPNLAEAGADPTRVDQLSAEGFQAYIAVPLIAKGVVEGLLEIVHHTPLRLDAEWLDFLEALARQAAIAVENAQLFDELQHTNLQLTLAYDATIEGWSRALDLRDKETEGHTQRVTEQTVRLARAAGLEGDDLVYIRRGALLHDMGKLGVPDHILLKPAPLTEEDWVIMRLHPVYAYDLLRPIEFLRPALDIPYCHHEKWDGTGYPRGLAGEDIPLAARLFAVVDVWDALRSNRPYRPGWPEDKVRAHLRALSGTHFEPRIVDAFLALLEQA